MKYIKLFEGFESDILTRTISFLKGKKDLSKEKIQIFVNDIKKLSLYDLPISKISDSDIKYLKTSSALKIRNTNEVLNNYGIYCIKYWFSIENGYLGFTGTGNRTSDYEKVKSRSNDDDNRRYPKTFTKDQLSYIYNSLKIKTGILKPVTDYYSLNTGDDILFAFGETYRSYSEGIVIGKIFVERGNSLFALHNSGPQGSEPNEDVSRFGFQLSWSLGLRNNPGDDFCLLHTYVDDGQPLRYIVNGKEVKFESDDIKVNSDYDFNLPCTYRTLYAWDNSNIGKVKFIEDSDFAIVLYLDDILNKGIDKVSEISLGRKKSRLGSSFLLDNESIRNENIDRYLTKLFSKHGIDTKRRELIKLEKLVNSMLCGKFSMIDMFSDSYIVDGIKRLGDSISSLITQIEQDEDKDDANVLYKYNNLLKFYKEKRSSSALKYNEYSKNLTKLQKSGNEELIKVFDEIIKIGDKIKKYISDSKLESLEDIRMIYFKLKSINDLFNDKNFILSRGICDIMHRFSYTYNQEYFDNNSNYSNSNDLKKLKLIEKYIDSVLK